MRVSFIKISKHNENAFFYIVKIVIWFANKKGRVGLSTYVLFIEHREFDDKRSFDERIRKREKKLMWIQIDSGFSRLYPI